jgi:putative hydrolase of the HAD superfamily
MNFLVSFWGLLVRQVDFWGTWRDVLHRRGDSGVVDAVAWVVEGVNNAGYEVPLRAIARVIASKTGGDPALLAREFIEEVKSRLTPMPCAVEFLRWAKEAGMVAVVSNTPCRCFPELFLEASGVAVDALITSDVLLRRKPLKPVFTHALRRIGARPHEAVYIGDGDEDLGAMGAGLLTIMVGREGGHLSFSTLCDAWSWVKANLAKD